ncbi:MAG: CAP domain-containing protein [Actinomycetota bacterium]
MPTPFRLRALIAFLLLTALTAGSAGLGTNAAAQTAPRDSGMETAFLASLNAQRTAQGLAPLTLNVSMSTAAAAWTQQMVNGSFLAHAGDIVTGTPQGWTKVGENVGRGKSVVSLTTAFMNSPGHAQNVLDPEFTHIGIAVYIHPTGRVYTTHRFAALPAAVSIPPAAPTTPATPTPSAAPTAEPTTAPEPTSPIEVDATPSLGEPPEQLAFVESADGVVERRRPNDPKQAIADAVEAKAQLKNWRLLLRGATAH